MNQANILLVADYGSPRLSEIWCLLHIAAGLLLPPSPFLYFQSPSLLAQIGGVVLHFTPVQQSLIRSQESTEDKII